MSGYVGDLTPIMSPSKLTSSRVASPRLLRPSRRWCIPIFLCTLTVFLSLWRLQLGSRILSNKARIRSDLAAPTTQNPSQITIPSGIDFASLGGDTTSAESGDSSFQEGRGSLNTTMLGHGENKRNGTHTHRIGCREYPKGGQSCVFSGIACIDVNRERTRGVTRPLVYLVDDDYVDNSVVNSDHWCQLRHKSSDPRYFANREWPPRNDLTAPRWSCLNAKWRNNDSLFNESEPPRVKWLDEIALVDLDYVNNDHNNHYVKDIVWLLDVLLWQEKLVSSSTLSNSPYIPRLFHRPRHVFLPQSTLDFVKQTRRDVNKLNFALIMQLDARALYHGATRGADKRLQALPLLDAYPALKERLVFYQDERNASESDLVCTRRLVVGSKLGDMGHERVCQHLREGAWKLFGIAPPPRAVSGYLVFERPPRRVVLLQRHITRRFRNIDALSEALRNASKLHGFEFEVHSTATVRTAEEHVRFFSRIGVLITPHGSQSMGGMWMPRHAALIEVFPPAYTDFAYNLLSASCNLWYYELQGVIPEELRDTYRQRCGEKGRSFYNQCVQMKSVNVEVDVQQAVSTVLLALKRLGHDIVPPGQ